MRYRQTVSTLLLALVLLAVALPASAAADQGVVNVNTADQATLQLLPRVGPAVAQRILEFREANGAFKSKSDLLLVRGIGERTLELMEPYITLDGDSTLSEKVRVQRSSSEEPDGSGGRDDGNGAARR